MKTYKFIKASTAGNRTGFFIGKNAYKNKKEIMQIVLKKKNLEAEQYAFLQKTGKKQCFIDMAGGEISGGAILASPVILNNYNGMGEIIIPKRKLTAVITGNYQNKIYVQASIGKNIITAGPIKISFGKIPGYKVILDGIAYFVTKKKVNKSKQVFLNLDKLMLSEKIPAIGIIEVIADKEIKPTVWVKKLNTITEEQGCTTGTISAQLCFGQKDGKWKQPSQDVITAKIKSDKILIASSVEILSKGKLYLSSN